MSVGLVVRAPAQCERTERSVVEACDYVPRLAAAETGAALAADGGAWCLGSPGAEHDRGRVSVTSEQGVTTTLLAPGGGAGDRFGESLALSGPVLVVGAPRAGNGVVRTGAVYVFRFVGAEWVFEQELLGTGADSRFGDSVDVEGDVVVAGATLEDSDVSSSGAVHVFRFGGGSWQEEAVLLAPDRVPGNEFGAAVGLSGLTIAVGAPRVGASATGQAYLFEWQGASWVPTQMLQPAVRLPGSRFGTALQIEGAQLVVGAPSPTALFPGSVHLFTEQGSSWSEEVQLQSSAGQSTDCFGSSVQLSDAQILVGAPGQDSSVGGAVVSFRFDGTTWSEAQVLSDPLRRSGQEFGAALAAEQGVCYVGSPHLDDELHRTGTVLQFREESQSWSFVDDLLLRQSQHFGTDVELDGDLAVVTEVVPGTVHVYHREGARWRPLQTLRIPDGRLAGFGLDVSLDGDVLLVGARSQALGSVSSGAVYAYRMQGGSFQLEQVFTSLDGASADEFGNDVAVQGDVAVIGAWKDDDPQSLAGSAYVFRYDGTVWKQEQKLVPLDAGAGDGFGGAVAIDGDVVLVGAPNDDDGARQTGSVTVFRFDGTRWNEEQALHAANPKSTDHFGNAVVVRGSLALVGSSAFDDGFATLFRFDGTQWNLEQTLVDPRPSPASYFGFAVDTDGRLAFVGAFGTNLGGDSVGAAYSYRDVGGQWIPVHSYHASQPGSYARFGNAVAFEGHRGLVGDTYSDGQGPDAGLAYTVDLDPLAIEVVPTEVAPEDFVRVHLCGGAPGWPGTLVITEVDDVPTSMLLTEFLGPFDASGERWIEGRIPLEVPASRITLRALALDPMEQVVRSDTVSLRIR